MMDPRPITDRKSVNRVFKAGAFTGFTRGKVVNYELDNIAVEYKKPGGEKFTVHFDDQIEIESISKTKDFSHAGDSGSLILDSTTNRPYALLFAGMKGNDGVHKTLANFLPVVLQVAKVRMVEDEHPAPDGS